MDRTEAPPIELKNVTFAYPGDPPVLQDVNLTIREGQFVGIVGATGRGKSTLLHLMAGIIPTYTPGNLQGTVLIRGVDTRQMTLPQIAAHVGVVTQDPENQLFNLLVKDEVVWALENRGQSREEMERRLRDTLAFFDISELRERITYDLSGGEKQRVVLASTYIFQPDILLLDDPTSQLDPVGATMVIESIKKILRQHQTVVTVESKIDALLEHADRLLILHGGRVVLDVLPSELHRHADLLRSIGIRPPELIDLTQRLMAQGVSLSRVPVSLDDAVRLYRETLGRRVALISPDGPSPPQPSNAAGEEAFLRVAEVEYTYPPPRRIHALRGVTLEIAKGSFVGIIGRNGSGKTTLARCISGYLTPLRGSVTVGGHAINGMTLRQRAQVVGHVFQNPDHQIFRDPVRADVEFGPRNLGWPEEAVREKSDRILELLGLADRQDMHPFRLSKGDRQRLAIAAVAVMEPDVLIVDEPTTGQDPVRARAIMDLLVRLRDERGTTILVITHAMSLVATYCDRVVAMSQGQTLIDGLPAEVFSHPDILEQTSVVPPPVASLALQLGLRPPPLTLEQAVERFTALFAEAS